MVFGHKEPDVMGSFIHTAQQFEKLKEVVNIGDFIQTINEPVHIHRIGGLFANGLTMRKFWMQHHPHCTSAQK